MLLVDGGDVVVEDDLDEEEENMMESLGREARKGMVVCFFCFLLLV